MIEIVKSPSSKTFYRLIKESDSELLLCAPYISKDVAREIIHQKKIGTKLSVVTSLNIANFISGSSDIEAIELLLKNGANVINYHTLHAKIYLFDNKKALITSANLTHFALYRNYEYGVLIKEDETEAIEKIYDDFVAMLDSELRGEFTEFSINRIKNIKKSFKGNELIKFDSDEDGILPIDEKCKIKENLSPWERDIFECLELINKTSFELNDVYSFVPQLKLKHPKNNNVEAKIRQMLQNLRDLGFIKFVSPGHYKKLWVRVPLNFAQDNTVVA